MKERKKKRRRGGFCQGGGVSAPFGLRCCGQNEPSFAGRVSHLYSPSSKTPSPWMTRASSAISLAIRLRRRKVPSPCSRIQPPSASARRALLSQCGAGRSLAQKVRRTAACWSASPPAQVGDISHNNGHAALQPLFEGCGGWVGVVRT